MHTCDMVMDFQFGSTGKGLLAGYLAKRGKYDTVVCSFATNAGHTYIDRARNIHMMTQQLPTGISSPTVKYVLIGPGALVDLNVLHREMIQYKNLLAGKQIIMHPAAAIVSSWHEKMEQDSGMARIGSTTKGVGAAAIQRIRRDPDNMNVAGQTPFKSILDEMNIAVDAGIYRGILDSSESILVEGAQGFSLSMYHGAYPYTTSRDVTPWQIAADCGLPFKWATYVQVWGAARTYPIRVNNREGTSGPAYSDQSEISFEELGVPIERTTVTKLPRRIFTFSKEQIRQAHWHCGGYWETNLFLNFANYLRTPEEVRGMVGLIETPENPYMLNPPKVKLLGYGPDDDDVMENPWKRGGPLSLPVESEGGEV